MGDKIWSSLSRLYYRNLWEGLTARVSTATSLPHSRAFLFVGFWFGSLGGCSEVALLSVNPEVRGYNSRPERIFLERKIPSRNGRLFFFYLSYLFAFLGRRT
uniref:Uncharacterized protein n=1 Tax=Cacopsylla melanoneura TaxID=428564 RepID=A0A8D8YIC8_9HEMI